MKRIIIFDLDETVVDSAHRTPNHSDGTLNLERYLELKTRENVLRDSLLPLANVWKSLCMEENYIVVCTARSWNEWDQEFLNLHNLKAHKIVARTKPHHSKMRDSELKRKGLNFLFQLKQFRHLLKIMFACLMMLNLLFQRCEKLAFIALTLIK